MQDTPSDPHLPLTDRLAIDRTRLANERTLLSYMRTAIMLGVSGVTLIKLFPGEVVAQIAGWALLPLAVVVAAFGTRRFLQVSQRLTNELR